MATPTCIVCSKPCQRHERNTDGTYAHSECLYANQTHPERPTKPEPKK